MVVDFLSLSSVNFGGWPTAANVLLAQSVNDGSRMSANGASSQLIVVNSHHVPPSAGFINRNGGFSRQ